MEKCDDGQRVFRCERLEEIEAEKYNKRREQLGQQIAEKLEAELEKDPEYNGILLLHRTYSLKFTITWVDKQEH